ncbi:hypothetical protein, partial [Streptococcus pneumoniae]
EKRNHPGSKLRQGFWMVFRLGVNNWGFTLATLDSVCRHVTMDANSSSNLFVSMWLRFLIVVHIDEYLNGLAKL